MTEAERQERQRRQAQSRDWEARQARRAAARSRLLGAPPAPLPDAEDIRRNSAYRQADLTRELMPAWRGPRPEYERPAPDALAASAARLRADRIRTRAEAREAREVPFRTGIVPLDELQRVVWRTATNLAPGRDGDIQRANSAETLDRFLLSGAHDLGDENFDRAVARAAELDRIATDARIASGEEEEIIAEVPRRPKPRRNAWEQTTDFLSQTLGPEAARGIRENEISIYELDEIRRDPQALRDFERDPYRQIAREERDRRVESGINTAFTVPELIPGGSMLGALGSRVGRQGLTRGAAMLGGAELGNRAFGDENNTGADEWAGPVFGALVSRQLLRSGGATRNAIFPGLAARTAAADTAATSARTAREAARYGPVTQEGRQFAQRSMWTGIGAGAGAGAVGMSGDANSTGIDEAAPLAGASIGALIPRLLMRGGRAVAPSPSGSHGAGRAPIPPPPPTARPGVLTTAGLAASATGLAGNALAQPPAEERSLAEMEAELAELRSGGDGQSAPSPQRSLAEMEAELAELRAGADNNDPNGWISWAAGAGGLAALAGARYAWRAPARQALRGRVAEANALERRVGAPFTAGERTGDVRQQWAEQRWRQGMGSPEAQVTMAQHDVARAQALREHALTNIGERRGALPRAGEPGPGDLESAGNDLASTLRSERAQLEGQASRQYQAAFARLGAAPVGQAGNISVVDDVASAVTRQGTPYEILPANTRARLDWLRTEVAEGRATQATVEETRQRINVDLAAAMRQGGIAERDMHVALAAFDDWRTGTMFAPAIEALRVAGRPATEVAALTEAVGKGIRARSITEAVTPHIERLERAGVDAPTIALMRERVGMARDIEQARGMHAEAKHLFGERQRTRLSTDFEEHVGRRDPGGRQIVSIIEAERAGETVMRNLVGNFRGSLPPDAMATILRIHEIGLGRIKYTNRGARSGVRSPGRTSLVESSDPTRLDRRLDRVQRFEASPGASAEPQLPPPEVQAVRRGYLRVLFEDLEKYTERAAAGTSANAGVLPVAAMETRLANALSGRGMRVTRMLFRPDEIAELQAMRQWLARARPYVGGNPVSAAALHQQVWAAFTGLIYRLPMVGGMLEDLAAHVGSTRAAARAVRPDKGGLPRRPGGRPIINPALAIGASAGLGGALAFSEARAEQQSQELAAARENLQRLEAEKREYDALSPGAAQELLIRRNLYDGEVDSKWGPLSRRANDVYVTARDAEIEQARARLTAVEEQERSRSTRAGPMQQALREIGPYAAIGAGLVLGHHMRGNAVRQASRKLGDRNAAADALLPTPGARNPPARTAAANINEFWRLGGAGERVPFTPTQTARGIRRRPRAAEPSELFPPEQRPIRGNDIGAAAGAGGEAAFTGLVLLPQAEKELAAAEAAAERDPSEANLVRLEQARDKVALMQSMARAGLGYVAGRGTGVFTRPYLHQRPNISAAEAEMTRLSQALSRKRQR